MKPFHRVGPLVLIISACSSPVEIAIDLAGVDLSRARSFDLFIVDRRECGPITSVGAEDILSETRIFGFDGVPPSPLEFEPVILDSRLEGEFVIAYVRITGPPTGDIGIGPEECYPQFLGCQRFRVGEPTEITTDDFQGSTDLGVCIPEVGENCHDDICSVAPIGRGD